MKLTFILFVSVIFQVNATSYAQITLREKGASLEQVIQKIRKQSGYDLFYSADILMHARPVTINVNNASVEDVLQLCFKNQPLTYKVEQKAIIVQYRNNNVSERQFTLIKGKIVDENGKAIPGATISVKGSNTKTVVSGEDGTFSVRVDIEDAVLVISFVGYKTQEVKITPNQPMIHVKMEIEERKMDDVVITGIVTRKKASFTGSTSTFTGVELKGVGNQNIIQGLRALDPSFLQLENNVVGSNPNALPDLEIRGQTSISSNSLQDVFSQNPNQPLFILDGFETDLRTIMDLDVNMVASATILKDAASTVLYGSRASNGVIVVETIKPKAGKLQFSYVNDSQIELPDLSSYNMMNSIEKLEFERLAGRYTSNLEGHQLTLETQYFTKLAEIRRGVDSYWLGEPLQNGFSHRHSITATGGDQIFRFNIGVNYRDKKGAMIGSGRQDWGGNVELNYRKGKVNIVNRTYIKGYLGNESPFGDYSIWVNTNPYYRKVDDAEVYLSKELLPNFETYYIPNPLYNAALNSFDKTNNLNLLNNTQLIFDLSNVLRFQSSLQLLQNSTEKTAFLSPQHTSFLGHSVLEKGSYNNSRISNFGYTLNGMLTYSKMFGEAHFVTANFRGEIQQSDNKLLGFSTVGYPNGTNGNPRFSYGYQTGKRPATATSLTRRNSILASVNYSYDSKYNLDFSYTYDGSTAFGSNRRYSPYYSLGTSWNMNREEFLNDVKWIDLLRLRVNIGETGNQNFGSISSVSTYDFNEYINRFGQGVNLTSIGNPDLQWQNTRQLSYGIDAAFLRNRLNVQLNAYNKLTSPLVISMTTPSSSGVTTYPFNVGKLNVDGFELITRYSPVYRVNDRVVWTLGATASKYSQLFSGFGNRLDGLNKELRENKALIRYGDGNSPTALWAVPSLGIDPATGREIFRRKDGQHSFIYDMSDEVVVGDSRPSLEGMLSSYFSYKGFTATIMLRYVIGRSLFNSAIYNKVENLSAGNISNNQDKRAFYARWKQPGDESEFKAISITSTTPMSSRFVQKETVISGESLNVGYEFTNKAWLKKFSVSSLRLSAYCNDLFYSSDVKRERGVNYPYTKTVSFSLNAMF